MVDTKYIVRRVENCEVGGSKMLEGRTVAQILADKPNGRIVLCTDNEQLTADETIENFKISVEKDSSLDLVVVQKAKAVSQSANTLFNIELKENASLRMCIVTLNGNYNNDIHTLLTGTGADCELNGLYLADGVDVINTSVNLVHKVGGCRSEQLFKGILSGSSKSSFTGDVVVEKDAQKTEAYQANNNLLVSPDAKAVSKPELIIYADDVKCSHGSTIGTLGTDELFYMRSRGISLKEARLLQQQAFAGAVLERISDAELRGELTDLVEKRLRQGSAASAKQ